jgi:transcriptional regulator with XRE-family HTH domain
MSKQKPSELFPARLRAARELRQINQTELALKIGLPATSISHFEAGSRKPSFDNLRRIAEQLNVTADYLLGRVDEPTGLAGADKLYRHAQNLSAEDIDLAENFMKMLEDRNRNRNE